MPDEIAIQQLLNRYSEGCSLRDWDQVMSTFVEEGVWEVPAIGQHVQGHAALRPAMSGFAEMFDYFVQINSPATIHVEGDHATARSIVRECGKFSGKHEALEVLGYYADEIVRTSDGWKFARRTFTGAGMHRFALIPGPPLG